MDTRDAQNPLHSQHRYMTRLKSVSPPPQAIKAGTGQAGLKEWHRDGAVMVLAFPEALERWQHNWGQDMLIGPFKSNS